MPFISIDLPIERTCLVAWNPVFSLLKTNPHKLVGIATLGHTEAPDKTEWTDWWSHD